MRLLAGLERTALARGIGALVIVAASCTEAPADPHFVPGVPILIGLFPATPGSVVLSLSESSTLPYDHFGSATSGLRDIYLWVDCATTVSAIHAELQHNFAFTVNFTPTAGILNVGSGDQVRLFMEGCVEDFPYLLGKYTVFDSGSGGTACLEPLLELGTLGAADCNFPVPMYAPAKVRPFFAFGSGYPIVLCRIPRNCHQMAVSGRGLRTRGAGGGDPVACGLMLPPNSAIASVDGVSVVYAGTDTPLPGMMHLLSSVTSASFAAVEPGDWSGFFSVVSEVVPPDVDVDLVFDITPTPGVTVADVAAVLQSCRIGTDHASPTGAILAGADLEITTPLVPLGVDPVPVAATTHLFRPAEPNPLTGATTLRFELPRSATVSLRVYDVAGRVLRLLDASHRDAGIHGVVWDGRDGEGRIVAPGIYFVELAAGDARETQKLTVIR